MAVFTTLTKNRLSWPAPETTVAAGSAKYLDVGSGFNLLIGNGYKLIIQPSGRVDQVWTNRNKYS